MERTRSRRLSAASGWLHDELKWPHSATLLATTGQIGLRKGQDVLVAAAATIVREWPETHFVLVGERSSTKAEGIAFEQAIVDRFTEQGLADRRHRLGTRNNVSSLLAEITRLAHPAHQEPFGRVLLEAAASGVPVVATNVGGTSEIVIDGETGQQIPPRDPQTLALTVNELLAEEETRHRMRLAARDRAVREFDIARAARGWPIGGWPINGSAYSVSFLRFSAGRSRGRGTRTTAPRRSPIPSTSASRTITISSS